MIWLLTKELYFKLDINVYIEKERERDKDRDRDRERQRDRHKERETETETETEAVWAKKWIDSCSRLINFHWFCSVIKHSFVSS